MIHGAFDRQTATRRRSADSPVNSIVRRTLALAPLLAAFLFSALALSPSTAAASEPPAAPTISAANRWHTGMLQVDWNDVEGATGYEIEYHRFDVEWIRLPYPELNYEVHFNGSKAIVDGFHDGASYTFRVRALNEFGESDWSEPYTNGFSVIDLKGRIESPRPRLPGSPSQPRDLTASRNSHLQVELSWSAPEDHGDSQVSGYRVEFRHPKSSLWSFLDTTTALPPTCTAA